MEEPLPKEEQRGYSHIGYVQNLERLEKHIVPLDLAEYDEDSEESKMREKLKKHGLNKKEVEVVVQRMVYNRTFDEAGKLAKIPTRAGAAMVYTRALAKLKERGYK